MKREYLTKCRDMFQKVIDVDFKEIFDEITIPKKSQSQKPSSFLTSIYGDNYDEYGSLEKEKKKKIYDSDGYKYTAIYDDEKDNDKNKDKDKKKKKKKKKDKDDDSYLYNINYKADMITNENGEKISKEDDDFYEMRFIDSLNLLNDTLNEIDSLKKDASKDLEDLRKIKQRGSLSAITNQTANLSSLLNTKINAIREINNVKKNISDFEIKRKKTVEEAGSNEQMIIDKVFRQLMNMPANSTVPTGEAIDVDYYEIDGKLRKRKEELMKNNELKFTEYESRIELENERVEIVIIINPANKSEWRFVAIDDDENPVYDYPLLPNPETVGNLKIDELKGIAKDKLGRTYRVFYY